MPAEVQEVKGFEVAVPGLMEINQNRHDFAEGQPAGAPPLARAIGQQPAMPGGQEHAAELIDVAEQVF